VPKTSKKRTLSGGMVVIAVVRLGIFFGDRDSLSSKTESKSYLETRVVGTAAHIVSLASSLAPFV
jgi:hypothetical protein